MRRRSFLKGLALGTAAQALDVPLAASDRRDDGDQVRDARGALMERYRGSARIRSGMALGGIGAGFIELRKNGQFYNWSIFNNFPKETGPEFVLPEGEVEDPMSANLFFKVRYEIEGEEPRIKLLQLSDGLNEGGLMGIAYLFPWMQAVDTIDSSERFPFTRLVFSDAEMPFVVEMEAWSPFIPHDAKNSALPLIFFDFKVTSKTDKRLHVMLLMAARNNVGYDTPERSYMTDIRREPDSISVQMSCASMTESESTWGQIAMASLAPDSSYYCGWDAQHPYYEQVLRSRRLPDIDDTDGTVRMHDPPGWLPRTGGRNGIDAKTGKPRVHDERLFCTLARTFELNRSESVQEHSFVYAWNFPNLYAETSFRERSHILEGHYYSNFFHSAFDISDYAAAERDDLYHRTNGFVTDFFASSVDPVVLEQVNSQLNTFVTSGRLVKSGDFGVLEGLSATWSWGPIATIDVMLYGTAPIIALFPELQKATMRCHARCQSAEGEVAHGLQKNFSEAEDGTADVSHRLDLPSQFVILVLRDYFWANDKQYLRELYPAVVKAIDYILEHRAFAGDQIPIMRGSESSYDNFPMYGYAAYLLSLWLCALACAVEAAGTMGDAAGQARYQSILEKTQRKMDEALWNGSYYRLYNDKNNAGGKGDMSEGCLTDQMVGQWAAHQCSLPPQLKKEYVDTALRSILRANYKQPFGLKNCSWPDAKPWSDIPRDQWFDQANTCWSGVELAFASFLLYEGHVEPALQVVHTVDARYRKSGLYWNHQEFGGHYFRPMSAWTVLNGMLGLGINQGRLSFAPRLSRPSYKLFFAMPTGTAHFIRRHDQVILKCLSGTIEFREVAMNRVLDKGAKASFKDAVASLPGVQQRDGAIRWQFGSDLIVKPGEEVSFQ